MFLCWKIFITFESKLEFQTNVNNCVNVNHILPLIKKNLYKIFRAPYKLYSKMEELSLCKHLQAANVVAAQIYFSIQHLKATNDMAAKKYFSMQHSKATNVLGSPIYFDIE